MLWHGVYRDRNLSIRNLAYIMKRKHAGSSAQDRSSSITELRAELTGAAKGTKSSIVRVLAILRARGELVDDRLGDKWELAGHQGNDYAWECEDPSWNCRTASQTYR